MTERGAEAWLEQLATSIYEPPLSEVRDRPGYPELENPLHLAILLLDADTEISMQGVLGFLENSTGRHLGATREALLKIGAFRSAALFTAIEDCMARHGVTWERLRGHFAGTQEFEITSFAALHPGSKGFADEVSALAGRFQLFNAHGRPEDVYALLSEYLEPRVDRLQLEVTRARSR